MLVTFSYLLTVIIPAIIVVVAAVIIDQALESRISNYGDKKKLPQSHVHAIKIIIRWIIVIAGILIAGSIFGIGIGRLWIVISSIAAMIIIGFVALWSILGNILAALVLMIWRPFQIGDKITLLPEEITGTVKETNLFFTKIETEKETIINITNTNIIQKIIEVHPTDYKERPKDG